MCLSNTIKFFRKATIPIHPICFFSKRVNQNNLYRPFSTLSESYEKECLSYNDAKSILKKMGVRPVDWTSVPNEIRELNITKITPIELDHHPVKKLNILLREATSNNDIKVVNNILSEIKFSSSFKHHVLANVLHVTAIKGFNHIAKLLIENDAYVDERYGNFKSTWHYREQINEDYENGTGPTSILLAVMSKNFELAQLLIESKADVNIQANLLPFGDAEFHHYSKIAPLHYAAVNGDIHMVDFLIKKGAAVDVQNSFGETPLLFAVWKGHKEVVELLLKHKANPGLKNNWDVPLSELTENMEIRKLINFEPEENLSNKK